MNSPFLCLLRRFNDDPASAYCVVSADIGYNSGSHRPMDRRPDFAARVQVRVELCRVRDGDRLCINLDVNGEEKALIQLEGLLEEACR